MAFWTCDKCGAIPGVTYHCRCKNTTPRDAEYPQAAEVCAELYQGIGSLASDLGVFDHPQVIKALDNASEHAMVHDDVLPCPSFEHKIARDAQPVAEVCIEPDYWSRGHFYEGRRTIIRPVRSLLDLP